MLQVQQEKCMQDADEVSHQRAVKSSELSLRCHARSGAGVSHHPSDTSSETKGEEAAAVRRVSNPSDFRLVGMSKVASETISRK